MNRLLIFAFIFLANTFGAEGQRDSRAIKVDMFEDIPAQIDGCSGLYTYHSTSLDQRKYIMVTDLQENAFMKVDGKQVKLIRTSSKEISKTIWQNIFRGNGYIVVLKTKTIMRTGDEIWAETGTIEISKGQNTLIIKIHGESGC